MERKEGVSDDITVLTIGGKKVFRNGHWHGGGDWDAEDVYDRLSFSWNDLGTCIGTYWFIGTLVHIPVHIGTYISTYWFIGILVQILVYKFLE